MTENKDINWAIFLKHMRVVAKELRRDFQKDLEVAIKPLKEDVTIVKTEITSINKRLEHLEQDVFILIAGKSAHEERLDTIEKVKLPKIRKSIRTLHTKLSDHMASPLHQSALRA